MSNTDERSIRDLLEKKNPTQAELHYLNNWYWSMNYHTSSVIQDLRYQVYKYLNIAER